MSDKVTFSSIVEELAEQTDSSQTLSHDFISGLTDIVVNSAVESGKASITNFGSFNVVDVAARNGVNPQTGEPIVIPAHQRLSFNPYKALENTVNAPFAHLEATVLEDEETGTVPSAPLKAEAPVPVVNDISSDSAEEEELKAEEPNAPDEAESDKKEDETPVFKRPGKEEEKAGNIQTILLVIVVLLMVVIGLWFFVFREPTQPQVVEQTPPPVEVPEDPTPNPPPAADQTATDNTAPEDSEALTEEAPVQENTSIIAETPVSSAEYVVSPGEWIYDIARKSYNEPTFWPLIFEANFPVNQDPDLIIPGKRLEIPQIENTQNLTGNDRARLASALRTVSEAYSNAGKTVQAENYARMAAQFSN